MLRIDRSVTPTMAKAPDPRHLGARPAAHASSDVVRRGHVRPVAPRPARLRPTATSRSPTTRVVVNCAADGLKNPPRVPIWRPEAITLQPVRAGFPCFGAALTGYVEATRDDDAVKNRAVPAVVVRQLADATGRAMNVLGMRTAAAFGAEPDIADWADRVALNPARVDPDHARTPALDEALAQLQEHTGAGVWRGWPSSATWGTRWAGACATPCC